MEFQFSCAISFTVAGMTRKLGLLLAMLLVIQTANSSNPNNDSVLNILVPLKLGFREFASWSGPASQPFYFDGFSVELFRRCAGRLGLPYKLSSFGDGLIDPDYEALIQELVHNPMVHGVIGDITINHNRSMIVALTQPYIQSTLQMIVPVRYRSSAGLWGFLQPFSWWSWMSIIALFCITGLVFFILEIENPAFRQEGLKWPQRLANVFWFTAMTLFQSQKEQASTRLGRVVTVLWLFGVVIFMSTYTANLATILGEQKSYTTLQGLDDLRDSNLPIGIQNGTFLQSYLQNALNFTEGRFRYLVTEQDYENALQSGPEKGGVAAILDEFPYVQTFLSSRCQYTTAGNDLAYFGGFGFAFKNSTLAANVSSQMLLLEDDQQQELQRIKVRYLGSGQCSPNTGGTQMNLQSVAGLYLVMGVVYTLCVLWQVISGRRWFQRRERSREPEMPVLLEMREGSFLPIDEALEENEGREIDIGRGSKVSNMYICESSSDELPRTQSAYQRRSLFPYRSFK